MAKQKVAIFDVDGTLFRSSFLIELVEALIAEGIFPKQSRVIYEREYRAWVNREGSYEDYIEAVIASFMKYLRGVSFGDFERIGLKVVERNQDRTYRYTRDLAKKLKRRGYFLLAVSQSPKGVLDTFCKRLGFNKVYGRFYELGASDKFTGEVVDLHLIANKANIVRRAVEKENLTLKGSYGIGDTEGDISMLELVDHPICFNPNAKLYRYAKLNGWKIVVERKDVVYDIDS
ncbi:HAD-IB family hydrolase [Patescibacteria group bacterium]|nr:HAD-IB family hydrolase [Patescibacteria group bacterium]